MIICEWEFLPKPTFPRLFTSLSSWAELVSAVDRIAVGLQTWQVLDQLGQTRPTNPSLGSNKSGVTDGSPDFKTSHNRMIDWELEWASQPSDQDQLQGWAWTWLRNWYDF